MDVVYLIGPFSSWNDNELRYSLRSLAKFAQNLGHIYLVGYCPKWVNKKLVTYIPFEDKAGVHKAQNTFAKATYVLDHPELVPSDRFLISSDDHFLIRPTDFDNYPIHYKGAHMPTRKDLGDRSIGGRNYVQAMVNTSDIMRWLHLSDLHFEGHANKIYDRNTWHYLNRIGFSCLAARFDGYLSLNAPMSSAFMKQHPDYPCVFRKDNKIEHFSSRDDLLKQIGDTWSFSIGDSAIQDGIGDYLQELFPKKCIFEV